MITIIENKLTLGLTHTEAKKLRAEIGSLSNSLILARPVMNELHNLLCAEFGTHFTPEQSTGS